MAKQKTMLIEDGDPAESSPVTETITYSPGPMDPVVVKWAGHTFHANVAKEVTGNPSGTAAEKLNAHLIESARGNRHFLVGNAKPRRETSAIPTTAEGYRAYVVAWLKDPAIEHADQLIGRLAKDRDLRLACEVGADDYAWLATLFMPKLHELAKGDELSEAQVSSVWMSHGFNELPW